MWSCEQLHRLESLQQQQKKGLEMPNLYSQMHQVVTLPQWFHLLQRMAGRKVEVTSPFLALPKGFVMAWEKQCQKIRLPLRSRGCELPGCRGSRWLSMWELSLCRSAPHSPALRILLTQVEKHVAGDAPEHGRKHRKSHKAHRTETIPNPIMGPIRSLGNCETACSGTLYMPHFTEKVGFTQALGAWLHLRGKSGQLFWLYHLPVYRREAPTHPEPEQV